jgi:hypothetical protein
MTKRAALRPALERKYENKLIMPRPARLTQAECSSKCSNRTDRHRPHATGIGLWPASTTSIDRVASKW